MPGRTSLKKGQTQTSKEEGGSTTRTTAQIEKYYSGGKRPFSYKKNDRGKIVKIPQMLTGGLNKRKLKKYAKKKGLPMPLSLKGKFKDMGKFPYIKRLTGGQAKIAAKAPPPNKIDEKDFAVLRSEKAKGRGMGLQDESKKPGKIYKAKRGMSFSDKMKAVEDGKINKKTGKPTSMKAMREMKGFKPGESASEFMKRRKELSAAGKALSATRIGKIALGVGAAGVAAQQYLKSKMKKKKELEGDIKGSTAPYKVKKKMGGGMMQKPMGYSKGVSVKARGCKLGRTKPTKIT